MNLKKLALVPAVVALGFFVTSNTWAGEDKNGDDKPTTENGDSGHDKHGGDGHDKNGGDPKSEPQPAVIVNYVGGGGGFIQKRNVRCVIGGYVYYVYRRLECGVRKMHRDGGYAHGDYAQGGEDYLVVKRKQRKRVRQQIVVEGGGYGYVYAQPRRIRYYSPASPAALMQAKKRARKAAAYAYEAGSYGYGDGAGYAHGSGHGYAGGGYYDQQQVVVVRKARKQRKHRRRVVVQQPVMDYGYDDGYGPIVTKGGDY